MKSSLPFLFSVLLLLFAPYKGDLNANPEFDSFTPSIGCEDPSENLLPSLDNSCYPPDWHYTYNISYNSATFEWEEVYGASYYTVQWRYPGGSWNTVQGYCYQPWITVYNFQPCTSYEWRVRSHCGYGYTSSWCYPVYFTTHCNS